MSAPISAPGIVAPIALYGGDDWQMVLTITDAGVGVDLVAAGWSGWRAQWRPDAGSDTMLPFGVSTVGAASGVLALSMTSAQVGAMGGDGVWDLEALDGGGRTVTWLRGSTVWEQDVTR